MLFHQPKPVNLQGSEKRNTELYQDDVKQNHTYGKFNK